MQLSGANGFHLIKADTFNCYFPHESTSTEIFTGGKYITKSLPEYNRLLTMNMF